MIRKQHRYVSDIDLFLQGFDRSTPLSLSQQAEIKKHQSIFEKRDRTTRVQSPALRPVIWEGF